MRAAKSLPEVHNATVPTVWPIFNILCYEPTYYIDALHLMYIYPENGLIVGIPLGTFSQNIRVV